MINAEVTAEKRPACNLTQHTSTQASSVTYKDQSRVQIRVAFIHKIFIVFLCFLLVFFVELSAKFCVVRRTILVPASWGL